MYHLILINHEINSNIFLCFFCRPGLTEYQAEAQFLHHSYFVGGCRHTSYTCICGSGDNSSILHYGHAAAPNDKTIHDGDMLLLDMGANYFGYCADITCSYPANGKFTDDQRFIYNAVLAANLAVHQNARAGVNWLDMHKLANRTMLEKLREGGLLKGEIDDMMAAGINGVFQPHGLGHLLGLDVHDVGGYYLNLKICPPRPTEPGTRSLRFARDLKAGMYVTIEPGCYFINHVSIDCSKIKISVIIFTFNFILQLLDEAFQNPKQSKFFVKEAINRFRNSGGIRIEDDVLVTENGVENFSIVPRTYEIFY